MGHSYRRTCNVCGEEIIMAQDPRGVWQPMDLALGGRHVHFSSASRRPSSPAQVNVMARNEPLTYPTKCWWCGQNVYFHSNGYGDAVLFDSLGWPWSVHRCWLEHASDREPVLRAVNRELSEWGLEENDYFKLERPVARRGASTNVAISGFVADNNLYNEAGLEFFRRAVRGVSSIGLCTLEIDSDDGYRYECLIPSEQLHGVSDFALVQAIGRWCKGKRWRIYIETLWVKPFGQEASIRDGVNIGAASACFYCGRPIDLNMRHWGFDDLGNLECPDCSPARSRLGGSAYIELCKRVALTRAR